MKLFLIILLALISLPQSVLALTAGQYESSKINMRAVYPRPDSETASWARHRKAYADGLTQYRIPVAVLGGAYPYYYDLTSAPSGMTIEKDWNNANYGIITWTPSSTGGPYTVTVRVTDQASNYIDITWTVTATTSTNDFIFLDPSVGSSGTGTKASPLKTFADVHKSSSTDSTYTGRILYLRAGTHTLSGPESLGNLQLQSNRKPAVWLGYPGESVTVDCASSKVLVDVQNDVFIGGLTFANARTDVANAHFWFFNQNDSQDRITFFETVFDNIGRGTAGSDNPAAICLFNPGELRNYFTLWKSSIDDFSSPIIDAYAVKYGVIERNTLLSGKTSSEPGQGLFLKSDIQDFSVRRNTSIGKVYGYGAIEVMMQAQSFANNNIEIAYNTIIGSTSSGRSVVYNWTTDQGVNNNPQIWIYRNSFAGDMQGLTDFTYTVNTIKNAGHTTRTAFPQPWGDVINTITGQDDLFAASGIIDTSTGALLPAYSAYVGTRGAILADYDGGGGSTITCYQDADNDLYGHGVSETVESCSSGYYIASHFTGGSLTGDCNDGDASIHPGATEVCGNSIDEDCSGADATCGATMAISTGSTTPIGAGTLPITPGE